MIRRTSSGIGRSLSMVTSKKRRFGSKAKLVDDAATPLGSEAGSESGTALAFAPADETAKSEVNANRGSDSSAELSALAARADQEAVTGASPTDTTSPLPTLTTAVTKALPALHPVLAWFAKLTCTEVCFPQLEAISVPAKKITVVTTEPTTA